MIVDMNINVNVSENEVANEHVDVNVFATVNVNMKFPVYLIENLKWIMLMKCKCESRCTCNYK